MNRKQRRKLQSQTKKTKNSDVEEKINLFSQLAEKCLVCESHFDKTDASVLSEWMVVVREDHNEVNLYCPSCWETAKNIISQIQSPSD